MVFESAILGGVVMPRITCSGSATVPWTSMVNALTRRVCDTWKQMPVGERIRVPLGKSGHSFCFMRNAVPFCMMLDLFAS